LLGLVLGVSYDADAETALADNQSDNNSAKLASGWAYCLHAADCLFAGCLMGG